ncbi:AraC family transcriptional regulator [Variovorax saccharolyticus]|uniref:AraC family transcriptional regulator n=1 Tax=Variovorax saccharolyticus TaxID=3053516 RepID=UPI00336A1727
MDRGFGGIHRSRSLRAGRKFASVDPHGNTLTMQARDPRSPAALHAADLSPLFRNCVLQSDEHAPSHGELSAELTDHALKWGRGMVSTSMYKGEFDRMQMYLMRYGAEVSVESSTFDDFSLVHMSLRGGAEIDIDDCRLHVPEGRAVFVSPRHSLRLHCLAGSERLLLKVPNALLREVSPAVDVEDLPRSSAFLVPRLLGPQWTLLMRSLLGMLSIPSDVALNPAWVSHFERSVALFLAAHHPADTSSGMKGDLSLPHGDGVDRLALADGERRMELVLDYMRLRLGAPVSLHDLARAGCVSERTLNVLCRRFHGMSPMELLRNMRLEALRSKLLLQPDVNITAAALEFGFGHAGRLAAYYKARFHELPSETQATHH